MPELPEVETIKRDLEKIILKRKIVDVVVKKPNMIGGDKAVFIRTLKGNDVVKISRTGKLLVFKLSSGDNFLLIHLKMTGQLIFKNKKSMTVGGHSLLGETLKEKTGGELPNKYSHVIIKFKDGSELFFNDMRRFGYMKIVRGDELEKIKNNYGLEPLALNFKLNEFRKIFYRRTAPIKNILLNQRLISGIGNIYADEILFASGVMPDRRVNTLSDMEIKKIFRETEKIIKKAIERRGTTFSDYRDAGGNKGGFSALLKVYGRDGENCLKCGSIIKKTKIAGRGTRFCPNCQK